MPKMFGAKFPLPILKEKIVFATHVTIPINTTGYLHCLDQVGEGALGGYSVLESIVSVTYLVTRGGLLLNFITHSQSAPGVGETYTYTVRINGAPTAITCQISGNASWNASDLVNTAHVVVGDRVTVQAVTSAAAAVCRHSVALLFENPCLRTGFDRITFNTGTSNIPANVTYVMYSTYKLGQSGGVQISETEHYVNYLCSRKGSLKNLVVLAGAAAGVGQSFVYTVRVNGVNTATTVTVSGAAQVTGIDIVNVTQIDAGNRITLRVVTSLAAAATTHAASFDFEEGDYRAG